MSRKKDPKTKEIKKLIRKLRKHSKYLKWKKNILQRDGWTEKDKGIQGHHHVDLSKFLIENNINTMEKALSCKELWNLSQGITLTRGEHFILTKLRRYKYLTKGFIELIEKWLKECKSRPRKVSQGKP